MMMMALSFLKNCTFNGAADFQTNQWGKDDSTKCIYKKNLPFVVVSNHVFKEKANELHV